MQLSNKLKLHPSSPLFSAELTVVFLLSSTLLYPLDFFFYIILSDSLSVPSALRGFRTLIQLFKESLSLYHSLVKVSCYLWRGLHAQLNPSSYILIHQTIHCVPGIHEILPSSTVKDFLFRLRPFFAQFSTSAESFK